MLTTEKKSVLFCLKEDQSEQQIIIIALWSLYLFTTVWISNLCIIDSKEQKLNDVAVACADMLESWRIDGWLNGENEHKID